MPGRALLLFIPRPSRAALAVAFCLGLPSAAGAHELWIEPLDYTVAADDRIEGELVNGQTFEGLKLPYLPKGFTRFSIVAGEVEIPVGGRLGDTPALSSPPAAEGLNVAVYVSAGDVVRYDDFATFERFVAHKDLANMIGGDVIARHRARGLPEAEFGEFYTRHVKALVAAGSGEGQDRALGLETEIVALANPYTDDMAGGLPVRVEYRGVPRAGAQVELFEKAPDGTVAVTLHRADEGGVALLPVRPGHAYLADAVVLREPEAGLADKRDVVWETLWAALTFAVPGPGLP
jgi:hypothetical protein